MTYTLSTKWVDGGVLEHVQVEHKSLQQVMDLIKLNGLGLRMAGVGNPIFVVIPEEEE
jgi:hypothetical protein